MMVGKAADKVADNPASTEILLIRHGETDWNTEKRLQGHLDIGLNPVGERQAAALGEALLSERVDAIISSDLQRAFKTAQAIATRRNMAIQIDPGLRERCYGAFEGLSYTEASVRYPVHFAAWRARDLDARNPSGVNHAETLREFSARVAENIQRIAAHHAGKRIAVVAHGGVLECVYRIASGIGLAPPRHFEVLNASINRIVVSGAAMHIAEWGNVSHLAALKRLALDEIDE